MISILLAVYNGEKYIRQSIDSILAQTFKNWELLIGFNGTTDFSKEIVKSYNDPRIIIFDYDNDKGKAKTLNKLIQHCKYEWCAMQDDDDIWLPNKLEKQIKYIDAYDVIGTYIKYMNENSITYNGPNLASNHNDIKARTLSGNNQIANSSSIFRKSCVYKVNCWNENIDVIEDFDLWKKMLNENYRFYNVPEYLTYHRIHNESNFNAKRRLNKL